MLKLGHGCYQRVIDGTFPVDSGEALTAMARDRLALRRALESLGAPLPESRLCTTTRQALRAAGELAYPVRLASRSIERGGDWPQPLNEPEAVSRGARSLLQVSPGLIVEAVTPGRLYRAILADRALVAVLELNNGIAAVDVSSAVPDDTRSWLTRVARQFDTPMMAVTWASDDVARPLPQAGKVVELDVAPILDGMFSDNGPVPSERIRALAAEGLLRHLFPEGTPARIPIVAVTGTNGKSTVCAMIARVMQRAGRQVGRAGTTGILINEELLQAGDFSGGKGHHRVFESPRIDFAVLETARGAATGFGLMFDHCDVAVCTNVTADHLGERGIDTVDEMARVKLWIVQRARESVVLNADDEHSAAMLPHLPGRKAWLVSESLGAQELRARFGAVASLCVAEPGDEGEWIALHDAGQIIPVMPVSAIPATLGGLARFNVSNALQTVAACYEMRAPVECIRETLSGFTPRFETIPGRLNFYNGLAFQVLFDFAHNLEGHRALRTIVDPIEVAGRKILVLRRRGSVSDQELFELAGTVAGGYDHFVCCDHSKRGRRSPGEASALLRQGLVESGVPASSVTETTPGEAVPVALQLCRRGDLLVVTTTTDFLYREWQQITGFE